MLLIPLIGNFGFLFSTTLVINVPSSSGANVFLISKGMCFESTGCTVGGYNTLAPKCDNSIASKYDSFLIGFACLDHFWIGGKHAAYVCPYL